MCLESSKIEVSKTRDEKLCKIFRNHELTESVERCIQDHVRVAKLQNEAYMEIDSMHFSGLNRAENIYIQKYVLQIKEVSIKNRNRLHQSSLLINTHTNPSNPSFTPTNLLKIITMRRKRQTTRPIITIRIRNPLANLNIAHRIIYCRVIPSTQPKLRTRMSEAKKLAWVSRNRIIGMGNSVMGTC
jgi:hypothetical protein